MADDVLLVQWPVGPDYDDWVGAGGAGADDAGAWVAFKLKSATFHIDTLEAVGEAAGFARLVGIEMALDCSLASLCGAFDASVAGIIRAAELYFAQAGTSNIPWPPIPVHRYSWRNCRRAVLECLLDEGLDYDILSMIEEVDLALENRDTHPLGWLIELQRLRNCTVHQQSLSRHIDVQVGGTASSVVYELTIGERVDGTGAVIRPGRPEHPVSYLRGVHARVHDLTEKMVGLVRHICPNGVPIARPKQ
jgi:hypothetical protein